MIKLHFICCLNKYDISFEIENFTLVPFYILYSLSDRSFIAGLTGLFCPCVLFGRNVRRLGGESLLPCICHAIFVEGGMTMALAAAITFFHGIGPAWTACVIGDSLVYTWMISGICFGQVRRSLQIKYHLKVQFNFSLTFLFLLYFYPLIIPIPFNLLF